LGWVGLGWVGLGIWISTVASIRRARGELDWVSWGFEPRGGTGAR
jgi:hypothetical protein